MAGTAFEDDAGQHPGDSGAHERPTMRLVAPPTYLGGSGCATSYRTGGFAPAESNVRHQLFLYFVGTRFVDTDESARYDSQAALAVTEAMARRGFVSLSVDYDNRVADIFSNKRECLYGKNGKETLLAKACAMPNVNCSLGIATWGHSQGGLLAHMAASYDVRVKAVWATGYGGSDVPALPYSRLRIVNGEADTMNGTTATLNKAAGFTTGECPDDGRDRCLRADGSGWIRVQKSACQTSSADHCWFDRRSCVDGAITLEPNWIDPGSKAPFALEANADWVAATAAR